MAPFVARQIVSAFRHRWHSSGGMSSRPTVSTRSLPWVVGKDAGTPSACPSADTGRSIPLTCRAWTRPAAYIDGPVTAPNQRPRCITSRVRRANRESAPGLFRDLIFPLGPPVSGSFRLTMDGDGLREPLNGGSQPLLVGETGFEPATSCSQSRRATRLRHSPTSGCPSRYCRAAQALVGPAGLEPAT